MKQPHEFNTLAEAQAYTNYQVEARRIRSYLIEEGKWRNIKELSADLTHPLCDASEGIQLAASEDRPLGFDPTKKGGQKRLGMLAAFISAELIGADDKAEILAMANYPYIDMTQSEFSLHKLTGDTDCVVTYSSGDNKLDLSKHNTFNLSATLDKPAPRSVTVKCSVSMSRGGDYVPVTRGYYFTIKAGDLSAADINIPKGSLSKWVKFSAKIDILNHNCTVEVSGA